MKKTAVAGEEARSSRFVLDLCVVCAYEPIASVR